MALFNDFCWGLTLANFKIDRDLNKKLKVVTVRKVNQQSKDVDTSNSGDFVYCSNIEGRWRTLVSDTQILTGVFLSQRCPNVQKQFSSYNTSCVS